MKRKALFYFLLVLFSFQSLAQLSGTYTIGGTTPDYPTFSAAVTDLTTNGVSGAVTFDVRNGIYTEKISIPAIVGASSLNTITFQSEAGDSSLVILSDSASSSSATNYTLQLTDADFITFRKMTIQRTGSGTYASVVSIGNNAVNNKFLNNHILGITATTSTTNNALVTAASGGTSIDSNNVFNNNFFENGSYGMYYNGQSTTVLESRTSITNNVFRNQYSRYISMLYQSNPTIAGNDCSTNSTYATMYGIYVSTTTNGLIARNKVMLPNNSGYGLYLTSIDGTSNAPFHIANNMIHIGGSGTAYGIYLSGSTYIGIYYNSVFLTSPSATTRCLYVTGAATLGVDVVNNALVNEGGGHAYYVVGTATAGIHLTNFNDLYTTGATLGFWTSGTTDLAAFQAASGMEASSVSVDPVFYSPTDLHVSGTGVNNLATPIAAFNADFDGQPRSGSTPDMGADEYTPLADNVGAVAFASPLLGGCGDSSTVVGIIIRNYGSNTQTSVPVTAEITGAITQTLNGTYSGSLAANAEDTFYFSPPLITVGGGTITLTAYTALAGDQYPANDTIQSSKTFLALPSAPVVNSPQQVCDNNVSITATADSGNVLFWYDQPGGTLLYIGNPFTPVISTDTVFYVSQHQGSGSSGCLRITECGLGATDFLEIENISGVAIDATGWTAVISNSYTDINLVNTLSWSLDNFAPGEIKYKSDGTNDNYWGNNMLWNPGSNSWAMIVDNTGTIVDFVAWGWTDAEIQSLYVNVNGFFVSVGQQWSGDGVVACAAPNSVSRTGSGENNNAADWACEAETKGVQNANLSNAFSDCGVGVCGSAPLAVVVDLIPGITVNLGNDTILVPPFNFTLDAGPGFTSYLWSTGETTQTISVSTGNIYWVTVTGSANGCQATDTILVNYIVQTSEVSPEGRLEMYPNPASQTFTVEGFVPEDGKCELVLSDLRGRELLKVSGSGTDGKFIFDVADFAEGVYMLSVVTEKNAIGKMLRIQR